ncbi:ERF family protein [Methanobrevibacter sp.]|uniref:ERF family protein n=1 Tax=Methanobrevibacter sp. TaxID=66852 RepID=UPI0038901F98
MSSDSRTMNIHEKVMEVNMTLFGMNIPKSGYNKHKDFYYHELEDMIEPVSQLCYKQRVALEFPYSDDVGILRLVDLDNPKEYLVYRITFPELIVEQGNPNNKLIQTLGANVTYLQRYLLKLAFPALSDKDSVDADDNNASSARKKNTKKEPKKPVKKEDTEPRDLNLQELLDKALTTLHKKGLSNEEITAYAVKKQIQKIDKFNKKELNLIYDFVNEYFNKEGASK